MDTKHVTLWLSVYSGVLIMDGGARRCLRADLTLDPVTADCHQNNFGDNHTSTLMHRLDLYNPSTALPLSYTYAMIFYLIVLFLAAYHAHLQNNRLLLKNTAWC